MKLLFESQSEKKSWVTTLLWRYIKSHKGDKVKMTNGFIRFTQYIVDEINADITETLNQKIDLKIDGLIKELLTNAESFNRLTEWDKRIKHRKTYYDKNKSRIKQQAISNRILGKLTYRNRVAEIFIQNGFPNIAKEIRP